MYRRILVPLDGSGIAEQVVPYVVELAKAFSSDITVLWITPPVPTVGGIPVASEERWISEYDENADEFLRGVASQFREAGVTAVTERAHGVPAQLILDQAQSIGADLVAMTTHGRGGLERLALGSVADEVVRRVHCPVLLVRGS